ncbi:MAG: site-specific DNA-methyltransferase, partial [Candidatus Cloacimonetes bacterium]|nr:site-specific DNA-methyltransferase [Candidatus Cloacimonadota bacterium]
MESLDYKKRKYLSAIESAKYLNISVRMLHDFVKMQTIKAQISASGQMRFDLRELKKYEQNLKSKQKKKEIHIEELNVIKINKTTQKMFVKNSMKMDDLQDNSVHLMITSPPYFDTKMYARAHI